MSYRGRGRGRGFGGGGGFRAVKQLPFELFPEIADFPSAASVEDDMVLSYWSRKFPAFWNSSPYKLENVSEASKKKESTEIKRFSDKDSDRTKRKAPLSDYIKMTDDYVPAELGEKKERLRQKKVRWNPDSDLQKLDLFEKREQNIKLQDEKGEKEKKEGEEEEDDENVEEEEEEEMSDDDYYQNIDFDDDEDDFNMPDDNDDEPTL